MPREKEEINSHAMTFAEYVSPNQASLATRSVILVDLSQNTFSTILGIKPNMKDVSENLQKPL